MTEKLQAIYQQFTEAKEESDSSEMLLILEGLLKLVEDIANEAEDDCDCFSKRECKALNEITVTAYQLRTGALSDCISRRKER